MDNLKEKALAFQQLIVKGSIDLAYETYVAKDMRHHNGFFKGDCESLKEAMKENHKMFPQKNFEVKKSLCEGDTVATFSHIKLKPGDLGIAVMHIFRFEKGLIAEMWDMGAPIPENSPNANGVF